MASFSPIFSFIFSAVANIKAQFIYKSLILALTLNVRAVPDILHTVPLFQFMAIEPCMKTMYKMAFIHA